jgi:hypothetical protein
MKKEFRRFEDARKFVQSLNLKGQKQWQEYYKSGNKPDNIPSTPSWVYKNKGWISWGDWLGTGTVAAQNKKFCSFTDVKKFVQSHGITSQSKWFDYCKSGKRPSNIPVSPQNTYKQEWKTWGDFFGTGTIAPKYRVYRSFKDARKIIRSLMLKNTTEWYEYCKSGNKPDDIPSTPNNRYKKEWKGFGDWLGTGRGADQNKEFRSFRNARKFGHTLGLKSQKEWLEYCKSGNKPDDIPVGVWNIYKKEWKGMWDFLGTEPPRNFLGYADAKKFVSKSKIKSDPGWRKYCKSGKRPSNIPASPQFIYKNNGWISWGDWLGTGNVAFKNKEYRSFEDAKKFVQSLKLKNAKEWKQYCNSGNKPDNIPAHPWLVYKKWNIKKRKMKK